MKSNSKLEVSQLKIGQCGIQLSVICTLEDLLFQPLTERHKTVSSICCHHC